MFTCEPKMIVLNHKSPIKYNDNRVIYYLCSLLISNIYIYNILVIIVINIYWLILNFGRLLNNYFESITQRAHNILYNIP